MDKWLRLSNHQLVVSPTRRALLECNDECTIFLGYFSVFLNFNPLLAAPPKTPPTITRPYTPQEIILLLSGISSDKKILLMLNNNRLLT